MWGSVGGVLGALYSLYWHAAHKRDFHKQYLMWYIVQPVNGLVIGGFVYLIVGAGLLMAVGQTPSGQPTVLNLFPYAVSCVVGFRQRFVLEIVDRFIQFLTGANKQQEEQEPPATASTAEIPTTSSSES
jgi:H+/Cl- antiporter ClcA